MKFLAVADPPWNRDAGGGGRGAQNHYPLAGVDGIAQAMRAAPPWRDVGDGLLWLWATALAVSTGDAHALARALGFRPCAGFVWAKVDDVACTCGRFASVLCGHCNFAVSTGFRRPARMGLGQWSRCEPPADSSGGIVDAGGRQGLPTFSPWCGWQPASAIRRVDDGTADGVDRPRRRRRPVNDAPRLKALGNAVVPQAAQRAWELLA